MPNQETIDRLNAALDANPYDMTLRAAFTDAVMEFDPVLGEGYRALFKYRRRPQQRGDVWAYEMLGGFNREFNPAWLPEVWYMRIKHAEKRAETERGAAVAWTRLSDDERSAVDLIFRTALGDDFSRTSYPRVAGS